MPSVKVLDNQFLSSETYVLRTERPKSTIKAGQCFSLGTSDLGINREYSMYSGAEDPFVDFLIRKVPEGRVSNRLASLKPGDSIQISGPYGEFCLPEHEILSSSYLFIASGTGIAPFHSFALTYRNIDFKLIHGVRYEDERYDKNFYQEGKYEACISKPENGAQPSRVTDYLKNNALNTQSKVYLCGNRNMIIDAIEILRSKGFSGDSIFTETFF
jgi:ferredoxin--NADP+ reductase